MFGEENKKKKLTIVCDKDELEFGEYLLQLISLNDDEGDTVIGCKDGSVNAAIMTIKEYESNRIKMGIENYCLFIGDSKLFLKILPNLDIKYDKHTIKYGWLGNKGGIYVAKKGKIGKKEYQAFLEDAKKDIEKASAAKLAGNFAINALTAVGFGLVGLGVKGIVQNARKKNRIEDELYRFAILHFYMNDINKFLGV